MHKISKQILKVTEIMSILLCFLLKLHYFYIFFLTFLTFTFEFNIFTFWYSLKYLGNKLESFVIGKIGKTTFTADFLTVANTLSAVT